MTTDARTRELWKRAVNYLGYLKDDPEKSKKYAKAKLEKSKDGRILLGFITMLDKGFKNLAKKYSLDLMARVAIYAARK